MKTIQAATILVGMVWGAAMAQAQETPLTIPLKPDPPPAIDGDLGEWSGVPGARLFNRPEQVVIGAANWKSSDDLSAVVHLAWRDEALFVAAEVTDDRLRQTQRGADLWKGDHIELYLDTAPGDEPQRTALGKGQWHFGFSPGNFERSGDALTDLPPEAVVFRPVNTASQGILVAAKRTEKGYTLEAAIPWALLGIKAGSGVGLNLEVAVSDTDGDEARQDKMMTLLTTPWQRSRARLTPAVLTPADGKAPPVARDVTLFEAQELKAGEKREIRFDTEPTSAEREAVLAFQARLTAAKVAGYTPALRLLLNGQAIAGTRLLNKQPDEARVDGKIFKAFAGDRFTVPYAPDFEAADAHPAYALKNAKLAAFEFRVGDLLRPGANTLTIEHVGGPKITASLHLSAARLELRAPVVPVQKRAAPSGPLPEIVAAAAPRVGYTVEQQDNNDLLLSFNGETFRVASQFSTPDGTWQSQSNRFFSWQRQIEKRAEAIVVRDTFVNLSEENLPLMQRHRVPMALQKVWLAGLSPSGLVGTSSEPANPTTFGVSSQSGIGLMPLDDTFQVHVANFSDGNSIGLADNNLVLKPGATHTSEWALFPVARPDYFAFVNAARRVREVNFSLDGSFAFLQADPKVVGTWSDQKVADFMRDKSVRYLAISLSQPRYKGHYAHGTAFQTLDFSFWRREIARRRQIAPDVRQVVYFHSFLDGSDDADTLFAADRLLRSDGTQGNYGQPLYKLFVPTQSNAYGRAVSKNVDIALDDLKFDGIYWDEMEYSAYAYHYGEPWDGLSADIDPKTFKIARLKSSVALLSQDWRLALAKRILARGPLIGNGAPHTRSMMQLHFPRFVESGSLSNLARAQLYTPIALGDHLSEKSESDAYLTMLHALDYGCLYYWYSDNVVPTHPTLTRWMFPITPLELGAGFIIGAERIITNRSGIWGWNDASRHELHVFDETGRETTAFQAPTMARSFTRDGKTLTELRLPEDWSAAIVRLR